MFPFRPVTLRGKLTFATVTLLVVILLLVSFAIAYLINAWIVDAAQDKVRQDLGSARAEYLNELDRLRTVVRFSARLSAGHTFDVLGEELDEVRHGEALDFLTLVDGERNVVLRAGRPESTAVPLSSEFSSFHVAALGGEERATTLQLSPFTLQAENPALAERARIPLYGSGAKAYEERGLVLFASAPWRDGRGRITGMLYGGILLNNNLELVDRLRQIIYGEETFAGTLLGSATIFLDDVRVATTIRLANGERALGTAVSDEVAQAVLVDKRSWFDRAEVVDQWYLTAYEPLLDPDDIPIGALYVGLLESPFTALKLRAALIQGGLLLLFCLIGYGVARQVSKRLSRPLLQLERMAERVAEGERDVALEPSSGDEIGKLTGAFNRMTVALGEREEELKVLNRDLEDKVEERSRQLQERSLELLATREELLKAERLAALGTLAAGVAHEINNPAAIIRGNVEILLMELGEQGAGREEASEILQQTDRIAMITRNMLNMARNQNPQVEEVNCNALLDEILEQVSHQVAPGEVKLVKQFEVQLPSVLCDRERLRQVLTNVVVNGLQALDGAGTLELASHSDPDGVLLTISDDGPGIEEEVLDKIFNPFYTTRKNGTGLGLAISYGLMQVLGGKIDVASRPGQGTRFTIRVPKG